MEKTKYITIDELFNEIVIKKSNKNFSNFKVLINLHDVTTVYPNPFSDDKYCVTNNETHFVVKIHGNRAKFYFTRLNKLKFIDGEMFIGEDIDSEVPYNKFKTKTAIEFVPFKNVYDSQRFSYNMKILRLLKDVVLKNPDLRFMQIIDMLKVPNKDDQFYVESKDTYYELLKLMENI